MASACVLLLAMVAGPTSVHAAAPPDRPGTFNGAPAFWVEGSSGSVWMQPGSSCWSRPTGDGGAVGGCADTVGFSCSPRGSFPGTTAFTVRPGELLTIHPDASGLGLASLGFAPRDVALEPLTVLPAPEGPGPWTVRAPDAEAVVSVTVRPTGGGGDASAGLCLRPQGEPSPGEPPTELADRVAVVTSQRGAMFLTRVDSGGGFGSPLRGSIRCSLQPKPALSAHPLWRCSSIVRALVGRRSVTSFARVTVAREDGVGYEHSQIPLRMVALRGANRGSRSGLVAVRGHLVANRAGVRLCLPVPSSAPIMCRSDRLSVRGLDLDSLDLITLRGVGFSEDAVVIAGRIRGGVLHAVN